MQDKSVSCQFGLVGRELELKRDIQLDIDKKGMIKKLSFKSTNESLDIKENKSNFIMIPGLINAHVHIGDSFAKEAGFNKDLKSVVAPPNGLKHQLLSSISKEDKIKGIKNALFEMISNGITCFADFREEGLSGINLLNPILLQEPIKHVVFGRYDTIEELERVFNSADGIGLSSYSNVKGEIIELLRKYKSKYNKLIATHCAEISRREELINRIYKDGLIDILVHGTHFNEEDLWNIKKSELSLIMCPRSNGYFGVGFPPINEVLRLKIPISIGTDNIMNNSGNLFEELRYLYMIQRVLSGGKGYPELDGKTMLKMITINAAKTLKLENLTGYISEGRYADFLLLDLNHPNFYVANLNITNLYSLIVQRTNTENIKKVYINGVKVHEKS